MSAIFTERLKERFAGQLSEGEAQLCSKFQQSFRATLNGQRSFKSEIVFLWAQLHKLRKFNFDVEEAITSGEFDPASAEWSRLDQAAHATASNLSIAEEAFLEDALGLIDWVVRNGVRFTLVLEVLGHDIGEISHHDFSLENTLADFVKPKVSGWARRNADPVGEADEQN
jgi:hypothetical protein